MDKNMILKNYYFLPKKIMVEKVKNKKVVFVDFFDTLVFRHIHSTQVFEQWEKAIIYRLNLENQVKKGELVKARHLATTNLYSIYEEPPYNKVIEEVYKINNLKIDLNEFISISRETDIAVEIGCQYANNHLIQFLKECKILGKKIYIISDFYLPLESYSDFIVNAGCENLIDGIFVSEFCNKKKSTGNLFRYVLENLGLNADECVMFGDSKHSDVLQARKNGIEAFWYFPLKHKIWTNYSRICKVDFSNNIFSFLSKRLYKDTMFDEYVLILYYFVQKLLNESKKDKACRLTFLSRGGYLLKTFTDCYIKFNRVENIKTDYAYVSRKVCLYPEKDSLVERYLRQFLDSNKRLVTVDEGWYCHSQQSITKCLDIPTLGYYLGTRGKENMDGYSDCKRKGILFDIDPFNKKKSRLYGVFCTNCSMYEQMLTSPEGSVIAYTENNGIIKPVLKENDIERELYDDLIADWQRRMLLLMKSLCVWNLGNSVNEKLLARMILRTSLFANNKRCEFLNRLDGDMVDNCKETKQTHKTVKDVKVNYIDLILHPDAYLGMVCKLQRRIYKSNSLNLCYKFFALLFAIYTRLLKRF